MSERAKSQTGVIIVAAGSGSRAGPGIPKQFRQLGGLPVLLWALRAFSDHPAIDALVVVLSPEFAKHPPAWLPRSVAVTAGGATRATSVREGLEALTAPGSPGENCSTVLVHDGARPFVSTDLIDRVAKGARSSTVIPGIPIADTVKRVDEAGMVRETVPRNDLVRVQTPQGFSVALLREVLAQDDVLGETTTDESVLVEGAGAPVTTVEGEQYNLKLTTAADFEMAEAVLAARGVSGLRLPVR